MSKMEFNCAYFKFNCAPLTGQGLEKSYLDKIESLLRKCGYDVWREVYPDEDMHLPPQYRRRVDLIFCPIGSENIDDLWAVEGKAFNTFGCGAKFAKGIKQIIGDTKKGYRELTYDGKKIKNWTITCGTSENYITKIAYQIITTFIKHFIYNMWNLELLEYEYSDKPWKHRISIAGYTERAIWIKEGECPYGK